MRPSLLQNNAGQTLGVIFYAHRGCTCLCISALLCYIHVVPAYILVIYKHSRNLPLVSWSMNKMYGLLFLTTCRSTPSRVILSTAALKTIRKMKLLGIPVSHTFACWVSWVEARYNHTTLTTCIKDDQ